MAEGPAGAGRRERKGSWPKYGDASGVLDRVAHACSLCLLLSLKGSDNIAPARAKRRPGFARPPQRSLKGCDNRVGIQKRYRSPTGCWNPSAGVPGRRFALPWANLSQPFRLKDPGA